MKGREACLTVDKTMNRKDWKLILEKEGVKVYQIELPGNKRCTMGQGYVDFTPEEMYEFARVENIQKLYDDRFDVGKILEVLPCHTSVMLNRFKGVMFVQS